MAEKPIDPRIDEALKKCNPQKAIYALAEYMGGYDADINGAVDTANKAEADAANALTTANSAAADASEAAENALDAKTQAGEALRASGTATTTANEALSVAQAADTLAGKAQNRANEAYAYAGDVDNKVIQTNVDLNNLKTATNSALIGITAPTNTSTVTLDLERIVGTDNVPLPVASATQAGVLNANDYKQLQDYAGRIGALEGSLAIYPVTLPSDNPSSEQITNAYTSQYPDAPNPPLDNTTVSDVQRKITYRYTSIGNTWIQVSYEVTQQFTNSSPGTIKGSTSAGMISANADGTGSLVGYDALNSGVAGSLSGVTAEGTATAVNLVTTKNNGTQTVVTLPQASNTQGGTISAVDYQKLQNSGVPIFTNDVLGAIKGSTEDGKISANEDGTGSLVGYDQIKTDIGATNTNVAALATRVNLINSKITNAVRTINAVGTGTGASINYVKMGGTEASTALPVVSVDQAGIVTPTMFNQWNRLNNGFPMTSFCTSLQNKDYYSFQVLNDGAFVELFRIGNNYPNAGVAIQIFEVWPGASDQRAGFMAYYSNNSASKDMVKLNLTKNQVLAGELFEFDVFIGDLWDNYDSYGSHINIGVINNKDTTFNQYTSQIYVTKPTTDDIKAVLVRQSA